MNKEVKKSDAFIFLVVDDSFSPGSKFHEYRVYQLQPITSDFTHNIISVLASYYIAAVYSPHL